MSNEEDGKKWKIRKRRWPIQVLIAGTTGFIGSVVSFVSEMHSVTISSFLDMKSGILLILLAWLVGMAIGALSIWLFCRQKHMAILKKMAGHNYLPLI